MPKLDSKSAKEALENGEFFAASHCIGNYDELCEIKSALAAFYGEENAVCKAVSASCDEMNDRIEGIESGKYKADSSIGTVYTVLDENGYLSAKTEPQIKNIAVDEKACTISIESNNAMIVRLISDGKLIDTKKADSAVFDLESYGEEVGDYVRFVVFGEGGIIYTQAFLLNAQEKDTSASAVDKGFFDVGFLDFLFGEINRWVSVIGRKLGK